MNPYIYQYLSRGWMKKLQLPWREREEGGGAEIILEEFWGSDLQGQWWRQPEQGEIPWSWQSRDFVGPRTGRNSCLGGCGGVGLEFPESLSPQVRWSPGGFSWVVSHISLFVPQPLFKTAKRLWGRKVWVYQRENGFYCFKAAFLLKKKKKMFGTVKEKFFGLFGVCFFQD